MKSKLVAGAMLAGSLLMGYGTASAEDIDLFVQPAGTAAGAPNVLILLDNTANWGPATAFANEIAALSATLNNLPVNPDGTAAFRVGLMLFTETGSPNSNTDGGYVRDAIRDSRTPKDPIGESGSSLNRTGDVSNGAKAARTYSEAYQYVRFRAFSGSPKSKTL